MIKALQSDINRVARWFFYCFTGWLSFQILKTFALYALPQLEEPLNIIANGLPIIAFAILMIWDFGRFIFIEIVNSIKETREDLFGDKTGSHVPNDKGDTKKGAPANRLVDNPPDPEQQSLDRLGASELSDSQEKRW